MSDIPADRNLLFGVVALQMDFITRDQLIAAVAAWMRDKNTPLSKVLLDEKFLDADTHKLLESLVEKFLGMHDNNVVVSLAKIGSIGSVREQLAQMGDGEIGATLDFVSGTRKELAEHAPKANRGGDGGGRFHILHYHAEGGFGQVSLAEDEELHREVAFKELKPRYADNLVVRSRFLMEAEITGRLEHPGIVPVYGLGHYDDGRPFYAMKFVRGDNLKTAIERFHHPQSPLLRNRDAWNLEFRKLLGRFLDVCNAIQYAHSRGVLHRDLKPSNIMMGKYGETLVMDWGLAKVIGRPTDRLVGSMDDATLRPVNVSAGTATIEGSALGTPYYMSPEQAAGNLEDLGPATDVYSLGATLYHLLAGRPAFKEKDLDDVLVKVCQGDFPPPRNLNSRVPRGLQSICLKAMALRPEERYKSPLALAEDVEHWLADEPISAHRDTVLEKLGRWMRRHKTLVRIGGIALLAIALISLLAAALINNARREAIDLADKNRRLADRESLARRHAVERLKEARDAVDLWMTGASEALKFTPNAQAARRQILLKAAEDYENFVNQDETDFTLKLERGRTYLRLGDVRKMLEEAEEAEKAYRTGEKLLAELEKSRPDSVEASLELANCHTKLGVLSSSASKFDQAERFYDRARFRLRPLMQQHPDDTQLTDALGSLLFNYGVLLLQRAKLQDAEYALREAAATFEKLLRGNPKVARYRSGLAAAHDSLGRTFLKSGRYEDAAAAFSQAIRCSDNLLMQDAENPDHLENRAELHISQAEAFRALGKFGEESDAYRIAIEAYGKLAATWPDVPGYAEGLGLARSDHGLVLLNLGRAASAEKEIREARIIFDRLVAEYPSIYRYRHYRAFTSDVLCQALSDLGQFDEALVLIEAAKEGYRQTARTNPEFAEMSECRELSAITCTHAGQLLAKLGRYEESGKEFLSAIEGLESLMQRHPDDPSYRRDAAFAFQSFGLMHWKNGKSEEARAAFERAMKLWRELTSSAGESESFYRFAWFLVMCPDVQLRDAGRALELARYALEKSPRNPTYLNALGGAYYRQADWPMCISSLRQAMEQRREGNAYDWFFLAMAQWQTGEKENARTSFQRGAEWMEKNCPEKADLKLLRAEAEQLLGDSETEAAKTKVTSSELSR
jgi:eukaryotic-like serine/threonine-protein kinase